ncbi:hypothetical protein Tco_0021628, partial [Tanacetum coccineum]
KDFVRSSEVLIEDWNSDDEDVIEPKDLQTTVLVRGKLDPFGTTLKFVPSTVLTRSGEGGVERKRLAVNKVKVPVNAVRINGVNTTGQTTISAVEGNRVTAVKASAGCVWRPKMTDLNNVSKDNSGSWISKRSNPQQALKNKGIFDSGCSRHMTGNKDFLTDY